METTFCELKGKEVINVLDGKRLGRIVDLVLETCSGKILGLVVPAYNKGWNVFKNCDDIFIPFNNICKIGDDVILVEVFVKNKQCCPVRKHRPSFVQTAQVTEQNAENVQVNSSQVIAGPNDINQ